MEKRGGVAMSPTKRNRLVQLPVDADIYALRNMVERCFNKLKNARRLATRYDKTADSYLGFIHLVSIRLWMRQFVNARSEEHTSELQSLMRISYAVFCLKKKKKINYTTKYTNYKENSKPRRDKSIANL